MKTFVEQLGPVSILSVAGSIDALSAEELDGCLGSQITARQANLVLDMGEVDYIGSVGLRMILAALRKCREQGGDLRVAAAQPGVYRIFDMSGAAAILHIYADRESALASFGAGPAS